MGATHGLRATGPTPLPGPQFFVTRALEATNGLSRRSSLAYEAGMKKGGDRGEAGLR
jgi:hypothetical protein